MEKNSQLDQIDVGRLFELFSKKSKVLTAIFLWVFLVIMLIMGTLTFMLKTTNCMFGPIFSKNKIARPIASIRNNIPGIVKLKFKTVLINGDSYVDMKITHFRFSSSAVRSLTNRLSMDLAREYISGVIFDYAISSRETVLQLSQILNNVNSLLNVKDKMLYLSDISTAYGDLAKLAIDQSIIQMQTNIIFLDQNQLIKFKTGLEKQITYHESILKFTEEIKNLMNDDRYTKAKNVAELTDFLNRFPSSLFSETKRIGEEQRYQFSSPQVTLKKIAGSVLLSLVLSLLISLFSFLVMLNVDIVWKKKEP